MLTHVIFDKPKAPCSMQYALQVVYTRVVKYTVVQSMSSVS